MKIAMKVALFVLLSGSTVCVYAGSRWRDSVQISDSDHVAVGTMADARGSADLSQQFSCYSTPYYSGCFAVDANGKFRSCVTSDPKLVAIIRAVDAESRIYFYWSDSGLCGNLQIINSSSNKPGAMTGF